MDYFIRFITNIIILVAVLAGAAVFMRIFYPDALELFPYMFDLISGLRLWPIVIVALIVAMLPRRRRRR